MVVISQRKTTWLRLGKECGLVNSKYTVIANFLVEVISPYWKSGGTMLTLCSPLVSPFLTHTVYNVCSVHATGKFGSKENMKPEN